jgi:hypothetical protein
MREPAILTIRQAFGNRAALARRQPGVAGRRRRHGWTNGASSANIRRCADLPCAKKS